MATRKVAASYHDIDVATPHGQATVHYTEAGDSSTPTFLLLMGFPSSSTQFRDFIPLLADNYHVLAPGFPGFGLTKAPVDFPYTFDNIAMVISAWLEKIKVTEYAMYIFDYGAPVGFRLALERPSAVKAIVTQNGNAYDEGFGQDFWKPIFNLWRTENSLEARDVLRSSVLTQDITTFQYYMGVSDQDRSLVDPEQPIRDYLQNIAGKDNQEHQLDLFYDYRKNKAAYPEWQTYLESSEVPVLALCGRGDLAFISAGAEASRRHAKNPEIHLLDAGHFALETKRWEIAALCKAFLEKVNF